MKVDGEKPVPAIPQDPFILSPKNCLSYNSLPETAWYASLFDVRGVNRPICTSALPRLCLLLAGAESPFTVSRYRKSKES